MSESRVAIQDVLAGILSENFLKILPNFIRTTKTFNVHQVENSTFLNETTYQVYNVVKVQRRILKAETIFGN